MAFAEAKRGRTHPLFAVKKIEHRPPTELSRLWVMAKASLAIDLLMKGKRTRERAARYVAKKLREYGFPIEGKVEVSDWKTVAGWREQFRKAKGHRDVVLYGSFYLLEREAFLDLVKEQNLDPAMVAERQLEKIGQSLRTPG